MKKTLNLIALIGVAAIAGCATEPTTGGTQSPIVHFNRLPPESVPLVFGSACSSANGRVVQSAPGLFQCAFPMGSTVKETTYQVMVNGGVTQPEKQLQFLYSPAGNGVDVTAITWVERHGEFGKPERDNVNFVGNLGDLLEMMKKSFENANPP